LTESLSPDGGQPLPADAPSKPVFRYRNGSSTTSDALPNPMARGIHLKQLRSADLDAIGVPDNALRETEDVERAHPLSLLAEADPVLSQTLDEVRQGLEVTLSLLNDALTGNSNAQARPPLRKG